MRDTTTIVLKRSTKKRLDGFFERKGETYDDLVRKLLNEVEEVEE